MNSPPKALVEMIRNPQDVLAQLALTPDAISCVTRLIACQQANERGFEGGLQMPETDVFEIKWCGGVPTQRHLEHAQQMVADWGQKVAENPADRNPIPVFFISRLATQYRICTICGDMTKMSESQLS